MVRKREATGDGELVLLEISSLGKLIAAGAVHSLTAVGREGGFVVEIQFRATDSPMAVLSTARGMPRLFGSLTKLAALLTRLGHPRFEVDATHYVLKGYSR